MVLLLIYEIAMLVFHLDGLSLGKLVITALVWLSFFITSKEFVLNFTKLRNNLPTFPFMILMMLLIWNLINILRTIFFDSGAITTVIGNTYTSLALLVPFVIIFGANFSTIKILDKYYHIIMKLGVVLFITFFIISFGKGLNVTQTLVVFVLLQPVVFLITILQYQTKDKKLFVLLCSVILFYMAYLYSVRTMGIREILLFACFVGVYLYHRYKFKWVLYVSFLTLLLPFILVQQSIVTGESAIKKHLSSSSDDDLSIDTRTFVYMELYGDLIENDKLFIGKGANGRYYSDYFSQVEGDSEIRLNIEVGVLGLLLKGGYLAVILNLLIFIMAIWYAFFNSKNSYVVGLGFILIVHVVLMFLENVINYSSYNFLIWLVTGLCLSNNIRDLSNKQIQKILS